MYSGPIGSVISGYLEPESAAAELPFASSLCGACSAVCPVKIDLPALLVHLRDRTVRGETTSGVRPPATERLGLRAWAWAMGGPRRYRAASRLLRIGLRLFAKEGVVGRLPGTLGGWTAARDLAEPPARTFRQLLKDREEER